MNSLLAALTIKLHNRLAMWQERLNDIPRDVPSGEGAAIKAIVNDIQIDQIKIAMSEVGWTLGLVQELGANDPGQIGTR